MLGYGGAGAGLRAGHRAADPSLPSDQRHPAYPGALPGAEGKTGSGRCESGRCSRGQRRAFLPRGLPLLPGRSSGASGCGRGRYGGQSDRSGNGSQCAEPGSAAGVCALVRQYPRSRIGPGAAPGPGRGGGAISFSTGAGGGHEPPTGTIRPAGRSWPAGAAQGTGAAAPASAHRAAERLLLQCPDGPLSGGDSGRLSVALLRSGRRGWMPSGAVRCGGMAAAAALPRVGAAGGMYPLPCLWALRRGMSCRST